MWKKSFGPLFVIIAALLWSFDALLRTSLYTLPPTVVVFYEHLFGAILLLPFFPIYVKDIKKMTIKQWLAIASVALFSGALGTIFYTAALGKIHYIDFSVVVLLQQLQPVWAIAAAALLLKEPLTKRFVLFAALALIAAYFITFKNLTPNFSTGNQTALAGLLALSAGFFWGSTTAVSKYVLNTASFLTTTALRFFLTVFFAFFLVVGTTHQAIHTLSQTQLLTLIAITLSTGMVALAIYYYGLKRTPARITTLCELVWPASAIFIDYFYFHKSLALSQILGVILLLFCLYHLTKFRK